MRLLSAVLALLLICPVLQAQSNAGAGDPNSPAVTALTVKQQDPPQQVSNAAVQAIGAGGFRTLYYWIVSHSTVGVSAPAGPFVLNGGPNTISSSARVTINWFPAPGVTSYDVLRTRSDTAPAGACNCAVATGVNTTTTTDQSETLQAYTIASYDTSSSGITLTNESYSPGVTALTARYKGQFMWQVRSDGSERRAGNYEVDGVFKAGSVLPKNLSGIRIADQFAGSDCKTKINAADADLGSSPGEIWVTSGCGTSIGSGVAISANHALVLRAPFTWTAAPTISNGSAIVGNGAAAVQTLPAGNWIVSGAQDGTNGVSGFSVSNLWANFPTANADNTVLHCYGCADVEVRDNHVMGGGMILADTSATGGLYTNVTAGNSSSNIRARNNFVDGGATDPDAETAPSAFVYLYVNGGVDEGNTVKNVNYGHVWWGGNANPNTDGAVTNARKASNLNFTGGTVTNSSAAWWGSMGEKITVTGVTADTCSDVCLDSEGGNDVSFSGITVRNGMNAGLATFYLNRNVSFGPGTVSATAAHPLAEIKNTSNRPDSNKLISFKGIQFNCLDPAALCTVESESVGLFDFENNTLINTRVDLTGGNGNLADVSILNNKLSFTLAAVDAFDALKVGNWNNAYLYGVVDVTGNHISTEVAQPAGSAAIRVSQSNGNALMPAYIRHNITSGYTPFPVDLALTGNSGHPVTMYVRANEFASANVTTSGADLKVSTYPWRGSVTTTATTSDTTGINGVKPNSHCGMTAKNANAAALVVNPAGVYLDAGTDQVTLHHANANVGAVFDVVCTEQ